MPSGFKIGGRQTRMQPSGLFGKAPIVFCKFADPPQGRQALPIGRLKARDTTAFLINKKRERQRNRRIFGDRGRRPPPDPDCHNFLQKG